MRRVGVVEGRQHPLLGEGAVVIFDRRAGAGGGQRRERLAALRRLEREVVEATGAVDDPQAVVFRHGDGARAAGIDQLHEAHGPLLPFDRRRFRRCDGDTTEDGVSRGGAANPPGGRYAARSRWSQAKNAVASNAPTIWARMKAGASAGRMPEKVSVKARATVTAGLANEVDEVNQ